MVLLLAVVIPHLEEELDRHYFAAMLQDNLETIAKGWMHDQATVLLNGRGGAAQSRR